MKNELDQIVKQMLEQHIGGEKFFENLDLQVQNHNIMVEFTNMFLSKVINNRGFKLTPRQYRIITTGKFGQFYMNWIQTYGHRYDLPKIFQVNGGLRCGNPIQSLEPFKDSISDISYIIIDDSYYSGKTVECIKKHVDSLRGNYYGTFVIYDGSKIKNKDVHSLYRYYK